jgi:hypothetical protein
MKVGKLKDYKDDLYKAMCRDLTEFEKNFLLIATGLLAFSITFIKDIVKIEQSTGLWILFIGWGTIIVSITFMMFAFLKSAWDSDDLTRIADEYILSNNLFDDEADLTLDQWKAWRQPLTDRYLKSKRQLKRIRIFAVSFFIAGMIALSTYVGNNLLHETKVVIQKEKSPCCKPKI